MVEKSERTPTDLIVEAICRNELSSKVLYEAVSRCDISAIYKLIEDGISIEQLAWEELEEDLGDFYTPIEKAVDLGNVEIVRILLKVGESFPTWKRDNIPGTVHIASFDGKLDILQILLSSKNDIQELHYLVNKALLGAILGRKIEVVRFCFNAGASLNVDIDPEAEWGTPLICAIVHQEDSEIVEFLLEAGANVNFTNEFTSPLAEAIRKGNFRLVKRLIEAGAEVRNNIYTLEFKDEEGKENQKILNYLSR